jgi:hypothetical protein
MWLQCPKHKTIKTIKCQKHVLHLQLFLDQSKLKTKVLLCLEKSPVLGVKWYYGTKKSYENNEEEKWLGKVSPEERLGKAFQPERLGKVIWKKGFGKAHEEAWLQ